MKIFIEEWLGVPFLHEGRNKKGIDCFGLIQKYAEYLNMKLTNYHYEDNNINRNKTLVENFHKHVERIEKPEKGSLVFFYNSKKIIVHIAILISKNEIFHSVKGAGVVREQLRPQTINLIEGYYRWKNENKIRS